MALPNWLRILTTVAPYVLMAIPSIPPVLVPVIVQGIADAEMIAGTTGAAKKQHVLDLAQTAAAGVNVVKPGTIDPATLAAAVGSGIDTTISVINLVNKKV